MPTGHTSALARAGHTPYAVLEVDEHYLRQVLAATEPVAVALLNLSRDQLDRAKEVAMMAELWRDALRDRDTHVVANADDPMVVCAARGRPRTSPGSPPASAGTTTRGSARSAARTSSATGRRLVTAPAASCAGRLHSGRVEGDTVVDPTGDAAIRSTCSCPAG